MNPAEDYILNQPEPYRSILMHLQVVVEHTISNVELKYKWRIPFYYINGKPFCYFNASHKKQFVDIAFVKGNEMSVHKEYYITEKRKQMMSLRYKALEDINDAILMDVLKHAVTLY